MAYKMSVKFLLKQSPQTKTPQFKSQTLELVTVESVINVVIGGFSDFGLCNCPITGVRLQASVQLHCLITTLQIN